MSSRQRYQFGSLARKPRKNADIWEYRYYEHTAAGRRRRAIRVGTVDQYPTNADALRAIEAFRLKLNVDRTAGVPVSITALIDRYMEQELPERHSTRKSYLAVLRKWLRPKWGAYLITEVKTVAVEQWLRSLELAPKTKTHIRNLMHLLYENARRWELIERNPIELVRQSNRRQGIPRVLSLGEIHALVVELREPYRTMVLVAACLGLRISEIMGLKWGDFDWENLTVLVQRSVVQGHVGETKTEYSRRPLPLDADLAVRLRQLRGRSFYRDEGDWVFPNDAGHPRWPEAILRNHMRPAAGRAGIGKIGWHTFRYTYSTMLRSIGTDVKVQQELLRHADIQTTMNIYTQAVSDAKREANSRVVKMVLADAADRQKERAAAGGPRINGS